MKTWCYICHKRKALLPKIKKRIGKKKKMDKQRERERERNTNHVIIINKFVAFSVHKNAIPTSVIQVIKSRLVDQSQDHPYLLISIIV